jgi:hypothetical protein
VSTEAWKKVERQISGSSSLVHRSLEMCDMLEQNEIYPTIAYKKESVGLLMLAINHVRNLFPFLSVSPR